MNNLRLWMKCYSWCYALHSAGKQKQFHFLVLTHCRCVCTAQGGVEVSVQSKTMNATSYFHEAKLNKNNVCL